MALFHRLSSALRASLLILACLAFGGSASRAVEPPTPPAGQPELASPVPIKVPTARLGYDESLLLSKDGRWMIFNSDKGNAAFDSQRGEVVDLDENWCLVKRSTALASWSPDGTRLVFLSHREGRYALVVWDPATDARRELMVFPRHLYPHPAADSLLRTPIAWSADAQTLMLCVDQQLPRGRNHPDDDHKPDETINVVLQFSGTYEMPKRKRERFAREYEGAYARGFRSLVLAVDVASAKVGVLVTGNDIDDLYPSPDGKSLAIVQNKSQPRQGSPAPQVRQSWADVYRVQIPPADQLRPIDLETYEDRRAGWSDHLGKRLDPLLQDLCLNGTQPFRGYAPYLGTNGNPALGWSPDSSAIIYATAGTETTGDIYLYELASGQTRNLTEHVELKKNGKSLGYAEHYKGIHKSKKFGSLFNPLWLPGGKAIVALGKGDIWWIPVSGGGAARNLTASLKEEAIRIVPSDRLERAAVDAKGRVTIVTKGRLSRTDSVWKLNPANGAAELIADTGVWTHMNLRTDEKSDGLFYIGQTTIYNSTARRLDLNGPSTPQALTKTSQERRGASSVVPLTLSWTTPDGYHGFGLLYVPERKTPGQRFPLVFDCDPGHARSCLDRRMDSYAFVRSLGAVDAQLRDGMAVMVADIPMSDHGVYERPEKPIADGVNAAVDAAIGTGLIDATRLGIKGEQYGAFGVLATLVQTPRFKAAAVSEGNDNAVGGPVRGDRLAIPGIRDELGPMRFAQPVWDDPQRYVAASPVLFANRITTPLLLFGDQERSMFLALLRLEQPAILSSASRREPEQAQRMRGWFREHLLGAKPITHIAEQAPILFGEILEGDVPAK